MLEGCVCLFTGFHVWRSRPMLPPRGPLINEARTTMQPEEVEMNNLSKRVNFVSRVCGATLLAAFAATAFGHGDDWNRTDKPLVWVDKDGKVIGRAVGGDSGGRGAVQVKIHRLFLIVPVGNKTECGPGQFPFGCDQFLAVTWGLGGLVFEDSKCEGKPYVTTLFAGSDRAVGLYRQTLYIGDGKPKSKTVTIKAVVINGVCDANVSRPPFNTAAAWEVEKTVGLWTLGKPPLYLK